MPDIPLSTYPNNWTSRNGGLNNSSYIAENTETGCRLSVSIAGPTEFTSTTYSLTAGEATSFADGAKTLNSGIASKEEVAALAVKFMRKYPHAEWTGGRRGKLVDEDGNPIYRFNG